MKYGFVLPYGDAKTAAEYAYQAEKSGWDGFFVWEPVWGIDAWVALTAAAMRTEQIRLGTMLTPVSRMRSWKLASETATLDNLSNGRVILSVGLGAVETGFEAFGEITDRKTRAELLDEGLEILTALWQGRPVEYEGKHYQIRKNTFLLPPPAMQKPRIPIWVVGAWPHRKSMQRVLRYDGLLPAKKLPDGTWRLEPDDLRKMKAYVDEHRTETTPFEYVVEGETPEGDQAKAAEIIQPWHEAGATWWIEAMWNVVEEQDQASRAERVLGRIQAGPPQLKWI